MTTFDNKTDGVAAAAADNKENGVVANPPDDSTYDYPTSLATKPGNNSGYKAPTDTALSIDDPRMS